MILRELSFEHQVELSALKRAAPVVNIGDMGETPKRNRAKDDIAKGVKGMAQYMQEPVPDPSV